MKNDAHTNMHRKFKLRISNVHNTNTINAHECNQTSQDFQQRCYVLSINALTMSITKRCVTASTQTNTHTDMVMHNCFLTPVHKKWAN